VLAVLWGDINMINALQVPPATANAPEATTAPSLWSQLPNERVAFLKAIAQNLANETYLNVDIAAWEDWWHNLERDPISETIGGYQQEDLGQAAWNEYQQQDDPPFAAGGDRSGEIIGTGGKTSWEEYPHGERVADADGGGAEVTGLVEETAWDTGEVERPSTAADKRSASAAGLADGEVVRVTKSFRKTSL